MGAPNLIYLNFLTDLDGIMRHVNLSREWVVVVCPESTEAENFALALASFVPSGVKFSGRTAVFPNGGRISVAVALEDIFVPDDTSYTVYFQGWGLTHNNFGMRKWEKKAQRVLQLES